MLIPDSSWCQIALISKFDVFRSTDIPIDPYWAAAMLASYRALLCIFGSSLTGKFKRRPIYISCCGLVSFGTLLMASYCFFNQDKSLTNEFPYAKWIPIIAIVTCYSAFALGLGSIPYMFQVRVLMYTWELKRLVFYREKYYHLMQDLLEVVYLE